MSIQYAGGTNVNTTFTTTTGTRAEIVAGIESALTTAGWSTVSGGGTGDVLMQSAATPDGRNIRVRLYDPGSGNCAQVFIKNNVALTSQAHYLLPAAAKVFRVIACKYQFFCFTAGLSVAREFVGAGVPYIPTFLQSGGSAITGYHGWIQGNATGDATTVIVPCFRTQAGTGKSTSTSYAMGSVMINGTVLDISHANTGAAGNIGYQRLIVPVSGIGGSIASDQDLIASAYRWFDNSLQMSEPLIAAATVVTNEAKIHGQLWDAVIASDDLTLDTTISFDSHSFFTVGSSTGSLNAAIASGKLGTSARFSLCVVIP